jgi:ABC-type multidrug transport system fused ATPase/permease subunit
VECEAVLQKICDSHHNQWKLDTQIDTGGRNLSQGQRQLIGLARAVLRRSPVVILDEVSKPLLHSNSVDSYGVFVLFGS